MLYSIQFLMSAFSENLHTLRLISRTHVLQKVRRTNT